MLDSIERLLILQDRDRKITRVRTELNNIGPERQAMQAKAAGSLVTLETAKHQVKQIESDRKKLELDAEAKKQQIEKYSLQQFQTKKNEEYRALAHEIDMAKAAIVKLEDEQLELMEQAETALRHAAVAARAAEEARKNSETLLAELATREENLKKELAELESNREELAAMVDEAVLPRYERLRKSKGETAVVGVDHGVCGGCHMKLQRQEIVSCQGDQEIVNCSNCGRILYYTREMSLAVAE